MNIRSTEEQIVEFVMDRFPGAELVTKKSNGHKVLEISLAGKPVMTVDNIGAQFFFPTNGPSLLKWSSVLEGGPEMVAEHMLRDMADADFLVLSKGGDFMEKSRVRIDRFTFCPSCNSMGKIKEILFGMPSGDFNRERYVVGGCCVGENDPEIQCSECDWMGMKEEVRFTKRNSS